MIFSIHPPRKPAIPPRIAARQVASKAAAGASNNETRVPKRSLVKTSLPRLSVPSKCVCDGAELGFSRN